MLIDAPEGGLACHVGIYFRTITWNGRKVHVGGIGGVSTREDCRGRGYATLAIDAAIHTMRANEAVKFAILFCEPHNFAFYEARNWHPFTGEVYCEQPEKGRVPLRRDGALCVRNRPRPAPGHARPHAACRGDPAPICPTRMIARI